MPSSLMGKFYSRVLFCVLFSVPCLVPYPSFAARIDTVAELVTAVDQANAGGDKEILLEDGTYTLDSALRIQSDGVTVRSVSGARSAVTLQGTGMAGDVSHIFLVEAGNFTVRDMTLREVYYHAIQMQPYAQAPTMINLHILDTNEQMIKAAYDWNHPDVHCDNGRVENCRLEYSAGIGPQYYIGGVDAHHAYNWVVRGNTFVGIRSPEDPEAGGRVAEHAIHFWSGSRDTLVEKNVIINCDRGVGFGLGSRGHVRGIIRNNMIYHNNADDLGDVGIALESVTDAQVYNNTVYHEHGYPNAIEYRFSATTGSLIANNLTNRAITERDNASATLSHNVTNAEAGWFSSPSQGDLHLTTAVASLVNQGVRVEGLSDDFDGDSRPQGQGYDIGGDEYTFPALCPDCSGDVVVIDDFIIASGISCNCSAGTSITLEASVTIQRGAALTCVAPLVNIRSGFRAGEGAKMTIKQPE